MNFLRIKVVLKNYLKGGVFHSILLENRLEN
jgi:hypothetical protein